MPPADLTLAINVAPRQLMDGQLAHKILAVVSKTKFQPSRLEVELTEAALLSDLGGPVKAILALKSLGIQVALDDFGTGYSSLGHLSDLPFDKIKIDRSFIQSFHTAPPCQQHGAGHYRARQSIRIPTIAEGIESERDATALKALDCSLARGILLFEAGAGLGAAGDHCPVHRQQQSATGRRITAWGLCAKAAIASGVTRPLQRASGQTWRRWPPARRSLGHRGSASRWCYSRNRRNAPRP